MMLANLGTPKWQRSRAIRAGLGDEKLTSRLPSDPDRSALRRGLPDKVRAMILDGAIYPNADQIGRIRQPRIQKRSTTRRRVPKAGLPLGTDPAKAVTYTRAWSSHC